MGDGSGSVGPATCRDCGHELRVDARFCDGCGARIASERSRAEYKQVTVLFADVVHSMDLAATVGAERLREIMAELFDRSSAVVQRFGGTVDKFTGDGIMAVFGAPIALEDHAVRACLAALGVQGEARRLGRDVEVSDGVEFGLRVGLNSGEVIAGDIGSGSATYTSVGEQVGMAQRMESVAPAGGVMISESTARLVGGAAVVGEPEHVSIKGSAQQVIAYRLLTAGEAGRGARQLSRLVGREWELSTVVGLLEQSIRGSGRVVGLVGPPGIGKSRIVFEVTSMAAERGVEVFSTSCESHTSELPFHAVTRLLRNIFGADSEDHDAVRSSIRIRMPDADPEDLLLLDDLLGIRDDEIPLPAIAPDARRRRLALLLNTAAAARTTPAVYVLEDLHWIDEASEAMLAQLASVMPHTHSLMLLTYRPEYGGPLDRLSGAHRVALAPLDDSALAALAEELLGSDSSVASLVERISERAAGNPFFAEEIIRDLAERGVVAGKPGAFLYKSGAANLRVPASLQAAIAARVDRLGASAKRTLNAAAVIGSQFDVDLLSALVDVIDLTELITAELVDQLTFTSNGSYGFRHPLIRTVAYQSQLKADRARLHRKLAAEIEGRDPRGVEERAALIAQHLDAAGDLSAAFGWHMRAAAWAQFRDVGAARTSWQSARDVADRLPAGDPNKVSMQIRPRTALCASAFRFSGSMEDIGFEDLRELCRSNGDDVSLALGLAGLMTCLLFHSRYREAARVASECASLLTSMPDQAMTISAFVAAANVKFQAGEVSESLRLSQRAIELSDGDRLSDATIVGSPLALAYGVNGLCRLAMGMSGWRERVDRGAMIGKSVDLPSHVAGIVYKYWLGVDLGALRTDATALADTAEALEAAERCGDDFSFDSALMTRGIVLINSANAEDRLAGLALLNEYRDASVRHGYATTTVRWVNIENAKEMARLGDFDGAIETARAAVEFLYESGDMASRGTAVSAFAELLIGRGTEADLVEARAAIERLAAVPVDPGFVLHELPMLRMRAMLARAHGDEAAYCAYRDQYRAMATKLGFEGHMAIAAAMYVT